ncbi:unnamed protein product [Prorocentrum cordatum]|nr:unnamed protein product [Polarella glacialis]
MFPTDPLDELVISELRNHDIVSMRDLSMPPSEGLLKSPVWSLVELMQKKAAVQKFVDPGARSAKRARTAADAESGPGPRHGGPAPGVVQFCTARDARLDDIHLGDAVTTNHTRNRRMKYLRKPEWIATFCGAFRINPPANLTERHLRHEKFKDMKQFEYFLWEDICNQPLFDSISFEICRKLNVLQDDFWFETDQGHRLRNVDGILDKFKYLDGETSHRDKEHPPEFHGKPVIDIHVVVKRWE